MTVEDIESPSEHGTHENDDGEKGGEPECRSSESFGERANVRAANDVVVEAVQCEIPEDTSPNHDVIADRPV